MKLKVNTSFITSTILYFQFFHFIFYFLLNEGAECNLCIQQKEAEIDLKITSKDEIHG